LHGALVNQKKNERFLVKQKNHQRFYENPLSQKNGEFFFLIKAR
jgi:hypothetical protein